MLKMVVKKFPGNITNVKIKIVLEQTFRKMACSAFRYSLNERNMNADVAITLNA